jgi:hypothetical protein
MKVMLISISIITVVIIFVSYFMMADNKEPPKRGAADRRWCMGCQGYNTHP